VTGDRRHGPDQRHSEAPFGHVKHILQRSEAERDRHSVDHAVHRFVEGCATRDEEPEDQELEELFRQGSLQQRAGETVGERRLDRFDEGVERRRPGDDRQRHQDAAEEGRPEVFGRLREDIPAVEVAHQEKRRYDRRDGDEGVAHERLEGYTARNKKAAPTNRSGLLI
jgi:hypothetical protein